MSEVAALAAFLLHLLAPLGQALPMPELGALLAVVTAGQALAGREPEGCVAVLPGDQEGGAP